MPRKRTHWEGCWRTHHNCALVLIAALEMQLAERSDAEQERERRKAAEALLRGVRTSTIYQLDYEIAPLIDAHFARYKD